MPQPESTLSDDSGRDTRAVVCERCSRLISMSDRACPYCGADRSGASAAEALRGWIEGRAITEVIFVACAFVYVASLILSGPSVFKLDGSLFAWLGPRPETLDFLGALDPEEIRRGEVGRLVSSAFLHAGLLHIGFNMMWLRSIGPFLEEEFGPFRFATIYMGSALAGGAACFFAGQSAVGASGAIFGLLGAGFTYGKRRGGVFGGELRSQFRYWAIAGIVFTFLVPGISIPGHLGGLAGGAALGWLLAPAIRRSASVRREPPSITILGATLLALCPLSFGARMAEAFFRPSARDVSFLMGGGPSSQLARWPLRLFELSRLGAPGRSIGVPEGWVERVLSPKSILFGGVGATLTLVVIDPPTGKLDPAELRSRIAVDPQDVPSYANSCIDVVKLDDDRSLLLTLIANGIYEEASGTALLRRIADSSGR